MFKSVFIQIKAQQCFLVVSKPTVTGSETFVNALFFYQLNLHTVISHFCLILSECPGFNTSSNNKICFIMLITSENNFDFSSFSFSKKVYSLL